MKSLREFADILTAAIDAIDGAGTAKQEAEAARKATANANAQAEQARTGMAQAKAQAQLEVDKLTKRATDLAAQIEQERITHETNLRTNQERSQDQINRASETLEKINRDIGLKRVEHDDLASAISRMKALAADLAKS